MVPYQTRVSVVAIVTGECTILLLQQYIFKDCAVLSVFRSSCSKVNIHLLCINTKERTTTIFSSWSPSSRLRLLSWYYKNTVSRFVWYRFVFIQSILTFISLYSISTYREEQQHDLTSLTSYHVEIAERWYFIRGCPIFVREIKTPK